MGNNCEKQVDCNCLNSEEDKNKTGGRKSLGEFKLDLETIEKPGYSQKENLDLNEEIFRRNSSRRDSEHVKGNESNERADFFSGGIFRAPTGNTNLQGDERLRPTLGYRSGLVFVVGSYG